MSYIYLHSSTMISDCILTQFVIDHYYYYYRVVLCVQFLEAAAVNLYFCELVDHFQHLLQGQKLRSEAYCCLTIPIPRLAIKQIPIWKALDGTFFSHFQPLYLHYYTALIMFPPLFHTCTLYICILELPHRATQVAKSFFICIPYRITENVKLSSA